MSLTSILTVVFISSSVNWSTKAWNRQLPSPRVFFLQKYTLSRLWWTRMSWAVTIPGWDWEEFVLAVGEKKCWNLIYGKTLLSWIGEKDVNSEKRGCRITNNVTCLPALLLVFIGTTADLATTFLVINGSGTWSSPLHLAPSWLLPISLLVLSSLQCEGCKDFILKNHFEKYILIFWLPLCYLIFSPLAWMLM